MRGRLDGELLAALVAAALEHGPAGTGAHPLAEAVGAGALALLGLVGALHGPPKDSGSPVAHRTVHRTSTAVHRPGRANPPRFACTPSAGPPGCGRTPAPCPTSPSTAPGCASARSCAK